VEKDFDDFTEMHRRFYICPQPKTMAQKESNHSSKDRTILWIILPCTIAVSLLFTKLNHSMVTTGEKMPADFTVVLAPKVEPMADSSNVAHVNGGHTDTLTSGSHH
jgi:hypothetical protein